MAIIRVEFARTVASAPSVGKWDIYSNAYFQTTDTQPDSTERNLMQRLFMLLPSTSPSGDPYMYTDSLVSGLGSARFRSWTWTAGVLVPAGTADDSLVTNAMTVAYQRATLPMQSTIAMGYRANVAGPRQRGHSRFWFGPINTNNTRLATGPGGTRLVAGVASVLTANVKSCLDALVARGWTLQVKSGPLATATFSPAVEIYISDMFGVMRTRHSWELEQSRRNL